MMEFGGKYDATIAVDFKKNRMRIHKDSLHKMDDPRYIQLLVNVERSQVAIRGMDKNFKGSNAQKVNAADILPDCCCEIYSRAFMLTLSSVFSRFDEPCTYRLLGRVLPEHRMVVFDVETIQKVES